MAAHVFIWSQRLSHMDASIVLFVVILPWYALTYCVKAAHDPQVAAFVYKWLVFINFTLNFLKILHQKQIYSLMSSSYHIISIVSLNLKFIIFVVSFQEKENGCSCFKAHLIL